MTRIQTILNGLEGNATEFKRRCETKICSPDLLADLNMALVHGSKLSDDIYEVILHLSSLKQRLTNEND